MGWQWRRGRPRGPLTPGRSRLGTWDSSAGSSHCPLTAVAGRAAPDSCSSALGFLGELGRCILLGTPCGPRTALSTRSELPESRPAPAGAAGRASRKVSVPTVNLPGAGAQDCAWAPAKGVAGPRPPARPSPAGDAGSLHTHLAGERGQAAAARRLRSGLYRGAQQLSPQLRALASIRRDPEVLLGGLGRRGWA